MPAPIRSLMSAAHGPVYRSRLRHLVRRIVPALQPGDSVLDVGCGVGTLGKAIMDDPGCPEGVAVSGLERVARGGEPIPVTAYDGVTFPMDDGSVDVVIIADVLHHEEDPDRLLGECRRVARRLVIVKDHQRQGMLARPRISFMDWAANAPYGVPCLYRYNTPEEWRAQFGRVGLAIAEEVSGMPLYPIIVDQVFGGSLQYMAFTRPDAQPGSGSERGA
ncbi:MAG: methyltransferase domain-containing protein [Phycisphaerales bacterium]